MVRVLSETKSVTNINLYSINLYFYSNNDNQNKELKEYQHNKQELCVVIVLMLFTTFLDNIL